MVPADVSRRGALGLAAGSVVAVAGADDAAARTHGRPRKHAADLVLHGGTVLLMDGRHRVAQAVAVRDGRVVAAGDDRDMRRLVGRRTTVVDLQGRTALPGINDSHLHGIRTGLALPPYNIDVGTAAVSSIAEVAAAVRTAAAALEPGAWVRGKGWNPDRLSEGRAPTRQDLDAAAPDNPVALLDWSNHQLWVNSRALQAAGITRDTPAPAGGVIVKDAAGEPTGLLYETAMGLVNARIPAFTREEQRGALQQHIDLALSHGITSYTEPGVGEVQRALYQELDAAGDLRVRVTALLSRADDTYPVSADQVRELLASDWSGGRRGGRFTLNGVKLRADGVPIASRTAWMREPYVGGGRGSLVTVGDTPEAKAAELATMIRLVHEAGLQVGTHACGDAAIDVVAAAYARALRGRDRRRQRHYVIHADFVRPETLRQLAANGCGVSFNPNIKRLIADSQPGVVGADRAAYQTPYAAALRAGVNVASASDSPNVAPVWLQGLETALTREGTSGTVSGADQRIGLRSALRSYTTAGAWQDRAEHRKGSLERGMLADICVLDGALVDRRGRLQVSPRDISDLEVHSTIVGGEVAYTVEDAGQRRATASAASVSWATRPHPGGMCHSC